ncbi:hypothetical protein [Larkinella sp. C7]|jgi:hypothetical protein|uniref:hypothetical protein n=1 Tax=Larkinella sp. C7 TaxID=2576607 RepID=UPI0011112C39|nr:hypothetical protein [Larkinella sp. C7]
MVFDSLNLIPDVLIPVQQPNAGGIARLRLVPADHLTLVRPERFPRPGLHGYADYTLSDQHFVFHPGASLVDVDVMPDYASFTEESQAEANGGFYVPTIQVVIPKVRPDVTIWLQRYRLVKWVALIRDRNGLCRCVGTPEQPLSMAVSQATGNGQNGRSQTALTFSTSVEQPAYYVTGIENEDLFAAMPDFDESFSFDFNS